MERAKPDSMYLGFSQVIVLLVLCRMSRISLLSPGVIFNSDFRKGQVLIGRSINCRMSTQNKHLVLVCRSMNCVPFSNV